MGLHMPKRARKVAVATFASASLLFLTGCSVGTAEEWKRVAMPEPASKEAHSILSLWQGAWIAAIITGVVVWALIFYAIIKYRRRSESDIPVQTRYNLPIEIFYTLAPVMMVIVFFQQTVNTQNEVLAAPKSLTAANAAAPMNVTVVGQQWSWTFNYTKGGSGLTEGAVFEGGTTAQRPTLWLVKDKPVSIQLYSPDVIHSFWVPAFLFKMDVIPGREKENHFTFTPDREGTFIGRCAELCGTSHSRMLFEVKVTTQEKFDAHMEELRAQGNTGVALGGKFAVTPEGIDSENKGEDQ